MTLLEAVDSLALIEANAVSCIHVIPLRSKYVAFFTIAILLPFVNSDLPDEYRAGELRLWRDQARLLESKDPIEDQILELHRTRALGNLSQIYLKPAKTGAREVWIIETHRGTDQERLNWIEAVIAMEGRTPWRERSTFAARSNLCEREPPGPSYRSLSR